MSLLDQPEAQALLADAVLTPEAVPSGPRPRCPPGPVRGRRVTHATLPGSPAS